MNRDKYHVHVGEFICKVWGNTDDPIWNSLVDEVNKRNIETWFVDRITKNGQMVNGAYGRSGNQIIFLNIHRNDSDFNRTLAHELGHSLLHKDTLDMAAYSNNDDYREDIEWEANLFAAAYIKLMERKEEVDGEYLAMAVKELSSKIKPSLREAV